jgi:hypothetical protein
MKDGKQGPGLRDQLPRLPYRTDRTDPASSGRILAFFQKELIHRGRGAADLGLEFS